MERTVEDEPRVLAVPRPEMGQVAGRLYFVSTLGSALGTLATSFYLVLWFEINTILLVLTGALVLISAVAFVAARRVRA